MTQKRESREVEKPEVPPNNLSGSENIRFLVYVGRSVEEFSMTSDLDHIPKSN